MSEQHDTIPCPASSQSAEQLDGIDIGQWHALLGACRKMTPEARAVLLELAVRSTYGDSLLNVGLGPALAEVDAVLAISNGKHPGKSWSGRTVLFHAGKVSKHLGRWMCGEGIDRGTGRLTFAHVACRALMALARDISTR